MCAHFFAAEFWAFFAGSDIGKLLLQFRHCSNFYLRKLRAVKIFLKNLGLALTGESFVLIINLNHLHAQY